MGKTLVSGFAIKHPLQQLNSYCCYDYYLSSSVITLVAKFSWSAKVIFHVFCFFKKKLKGELAYESYAGGILIIILIENLNDYCYVLY